MIAGRVVNREIVIEIEVSTPGQPPDRVRAVIDTGYNGYITLPGSLISRLGLLLVGHRHGRLANGTIALLNVYLASVVWHGRHEEVLVSEAAGTPLVGMSLLEGNRLTIDAIEGGNVTIEELP